LFPLAAEGRPFSALFKLENGATTVLAAFQQSQRHRINIRHKQKAGLITPLFLAYF